MKRYHFEVWKYMKNVKGILKKTQNRFQSSSLAVFPLGSEKDKGLKELWHPLLNLPLLQEDSCDNLPFTHTPRMNTLTFTRTAHQQTLTTQLGCQMQQSVSAVSARCHTGPKINARKQVSTQPHTFVHAQMSVHGADHQNKRRCSCLPARLLFLSDWCSSSVWSSRRWLCD